MHSIYTNVKTKQMTLVGLMTAILCILAPISIVLPFSPIPLSLGTLAIYFVLIVQDGKYGIISILLYLLLGLVGIPVFSGFSGGIGRLFEPTGGYLIGYLPLGLIGSIFLNRYGKRFFTCLIGLLLGTLTCYCLGTVWLAYQTNLSISSALTVGVLPFLPGDAVKLVGGSYLGLQVRTRLKRAGMF